MLSLKTISSSSFNALSTSIHTITFENGLMTSIGLVMVHLILENQYFLLECLLFMEHCLVVSHTPSAFPRSNNNK
jgi:hypothetical protein